MAKIFIGLFLSYVVSTAAMAGDLDITYEQIATATIATATFRTNGYAIPGDGGDAFYVTASGPTLCGAQDAAAHYFKLDISKPVNVLACGAIGDNSTSDLAAIQAAINLCQGFTGAYGSPSCDVYAPPYRTYLINGSITIDNPIGLDFRGYINYTPTSGCAVVIGGNAPRSEPQGYDLKFRGLVASGNQAGKTNPPSASGTCGVHVLLMTFSPRGITVDMMEGFTYAGFWCDGGGATTSYAQVIQHNTFYLGQMVSNGYNVLLTSLDAATSSCEANRWFVQQSYGGWTDIQIGFPGRNSVEASTSNTFFVNAMDSAISKVSVDDSSAFNTVNINYSGAQIVLEMVSSRSTYNIGNSAGTGAVVFNYGTNNKINQQN